MAWSEDRIHRWLAAAGKPAALSGSHGHDAAVLRAWRGRTVACVDQTSEGVHFLASTPARDVGRKAVARALSDLAATAARPRAVWLALCAPQTRDERWIRALVGGVRALAGEYGADLVGGDLCSRAAPAHVSVTALGTYEGRGAPPGRDRARAGDVVVITGAVGGSILGRHLRITPRVAQARWLQRCGARAMMDVSDGLAWDLHRLARASHVAIDLDLDRVPVHTDAVRLARTSRKPPVWHALHDGEDHEIVATVPARALPRLLAGAALHCAGFAPIGRVRSGSGLYTGTRAGARQRWRSTEGGWRHGR